MDNAAPEDLQLALCEPIVSRPPLIPYSRLARGASTATRSVVKGTRNVLSRLGAERAIEAVNEGKAGQVTGMVALDCGLAKLGQLGKGATHRVVLIRSSTQLCRQLRSMDDG